MKPLRYATLLTLGMSAALAGEGRVLFVCEAGTATCELAAERFEAASRANGWHLAGRAAFVDDLTEADLALAAIVVTLDASLYRRWLLSIKRLETWNGIPAAEHDRTAAIGEIDRRIAALMR